MTDAPFLYALLSLMIVGWTGNYIAGKIALHSIPAVLLFGCRISMAAILILPAYIWERRRNKATWTRHDLPLILLIGVFGVSLNQLLFVVGLGGTSVAHAAIFGNLSPMLVLLLASARGLERLTPSKLAGVVVSLGGVVLLRAMDAQPQGEATFLGDVIIFSASAVFATFTVLGKPTARKYGSITVNTIAYVGGAILMAPVTIWKAATYPLSNIPVSAWLAVFYMALVPSVICYLIYYYALAHMEASQLAAFNYLIPPLATLLGIVTLREHITLWTVVAAMVIFGGIFMVERAR